MKRNSKGHFAKGNKGGGRPKGSKAQKTKDWEEMREFIKDDLVPKYVDKVKQMMDSGDNDVEIEGMNKLLNILEYFAPKLSRSEVKNEGGQQITIRKIVEDGNSKS